MTKNNIRLKRFSLFSEFVEKHIRVSGDHPICVDGVHVTVIKTTPIYKRKGVVIAIPGATRWSNTYQDF